MSDSAVLAWLAQCRQLAQHSMPAVGSVVAAVSASASVQTAFVPSPAVFVACRVRQQVCLCEWVPAGLRASISQVLSELRKRLVCVLTTKSQHYSVDFCG